MLSGRSDFWHLAKRKPFWAMKLLRRPRIFWAILSGAVFVTVLEDLEES